jgi:fukutin-related protein
VKTLVQITNFGCRKDTPSCIGKVFNRKPFYFYTNQQTPPCCLDKLKKIFHYVIKELESAGVRYWLDNSALKHAILYGNDLAHNAYEIDISFNFIDFNRSSCIKRGYFRAFADLEGFYWIKATDGYYLKIQFSKLNDIHVNLLPFEIKNNYVVPKGFYGIKAKIFSEEYLHPMSTTFFAGKNIFIPNNTKKYLAIKWP